MTEKKTFLRYLNEQIENVEGLMLVGIYNSAREAIFKEVNPEMNQPQLEDLLFNQSFEVFDRLHKVDVDEPIIITAMYSIMHVVQFNVSEYYGTIIADTYTNIGHLHEMAKTICKQLERLSGFEGKWRNKPASIEAHTGDVLDGYKMS